MTGNNTTSQERIPAALQAVFIAAARGKEITVAPPNKVAMKVFRPRWKLGGKRNSKDKDSKNNTAPPSKMESSTGSPSVPPRTVLDSSSSSKTRNHISPQTYLTSVLKNRGYCTEEFCSLETAYHNRPTRLQVASYGSHLLDSIRRNDVLAVKELLQLGVSPNACNEFGESVVHMVCRLGLDQMLSVLLEFGATVQISDDHGRTPLHEVCWSKTPNFDIVDILTRYDRRLFYITDSEGIVPLQHVREHNWTEWTKYLMARKNKFWPDRDIKKEGFQGIPILAKEAPFSRPIPDPEEAADMSVQALALVAKGQISVFEASMYKDTDDDSDSSTADETLTHTVDEDDYDDDDDDDFSVATFDEDEMEAILGNMGGGGLGLAWKSTQVGI